MRITSKQQLSPWRKIGVYLTIFEDNTKIIQPEKKSNLSKTLSDIASIENALSEQLSSVAMIVTKSSIGINELVKNLTDKKSQILNVVKTLLQLQNKVTAKETLNSLRRRLK